MPTIKKIGPKVLAISTGTNGVQPNSNTSFTYSPNYNDLDKATGLAISNDAVSFDTYGNHYFKLYNNVIVTVNVGTPYVSGGVSHQSIAWSVAKNGSVIYTTSYDMSASGSAGIKGLFYFVMAPESFSSYSSVSVFTLVWCVRIGSATNPRYHGYKSPTTAISRTILGDVPINPPTDPYYPGETSGDDNTSGMGGTGTFDGSTDEIGAPNLPSLSAVQTGFITLYNPTLSQLVSLADYMWDANSFDISTWQKSFANPMDAIIGLSIVPVQPTVSAAIGVKVGNYTSTVTMPVVTSQFVTVDCGSLTIQEYWGSYLDYSPYTRASIYLPYIGIQQIDIDDIMGKTISVKYNVDVLSGSCCAFITCGGSVLYTFAGSCSVQIPVNGQGYSNMISAGTGVLASLASKGLSLLASNTGGILSGISSGINSVANWWDGTNYGASAYVPALSEAASNASSVTDAYGQSKLAINRSDAISSSSGVLGIQYPYLIVQRPKQCLPNNQNKYIGYPCMITRTLSSCSGFTQIDSIHLEHVPCTAAEADEIIAMLKGGVIINEPPNKALHE